MHRLSDHALDCNKRGRAGEHKLIGRAQRHRDSSLETHAVSTHSVDTLRAVLPPPKIPATSASRQPVKRISYTEVSMQNDRTILTDSISHSRINTAARNDVQEQTDEQPSSGVAWLKWATALVALTLLLLLFLKLR